jgi:hypothetical protein
MNDDSGPGFKPFGSEAAAVEPKAASPKKKRKSMKLLLIPLVIILAAALGAAGWLLTKADVTPLSPYQEKYGFELYYPSQLPQGYALKEGSVIADKTILFFELENGDNKIRVSEQRMPNPKPEIGNAEGNDSVKKITNEHGSGYLGSSRSVPVGVFYTDTTLINFTATKDVPPDVITAVMTNLQD